MTRVSLAVALLCLAGCAHGPCRVQSAEQIALGLRASDAVVAKLKAGSITAVEAEVLLEMHAADAKAGFPTYNECLP